MRNKFPVPYRAADDGGGAAPAAPTASPPAGAVTAPAATPPAATPPAATPAPSAGERLRQAAGAAPPAAAPAATGTAPPAAASSSPPPGEPPAWAAAVPEAYRGATPEETVGKLTAALSASMPGADAAAYTAAFKPEGAVADYAGVLAGDRFFGDLAGDAMAAGLSPGAYNTFINKVLERALSSGVIEPMVSADAVFKALAPTDGSHSPEQGLAAARAEVADNATWVDGLKTKWPAPAVKALEDAFGTVEGQHLIRQLRMSSAEKGVVPGGGGAPTEADLDARIKDPRNQWGGPDYSEKFAAETRALADRLDAGKRRT